MLIGKQTPLNDTIHEALMSFVSEAKRVSPQEFVNSENGIASGSHIVFVNLTDLTNEEGAILDKLKKAPLKPKVVGMHTFMVPAMKEEVLERGFDGYLSFFEFADEIEGLLDSLGVPMKS